MAFYLHFYGGRADIDVAHLLMAVAMAGMLVPGWPSCWSS
jgi:hypothetical protein